MVELKPSSPSSGTNRKRASSAPDVSIDQAAVTSPPSASATTPSNGNGGGVAFSPSTNVPPAGSSPASRSPSSPARFATSGGTGGPRTPGLESPTHGSSDGVSNALPSVTQSLPPKLPPGGMGKKSTSQRQFDLCTTLYKRRGGFGRNAENNWYVFALLIHAYLQCMFCHVPLLRQHLLCSSRYQWLHAGSKDASPFMARSFATTIRPSFRNLIPPDLVEDSICRKKRLGRRCPPNMALIPPRSSW